MEAALRHLDGSLAGDKLRGTLRLTNLAQRRPDNVNLPTLRRVLTTDDGAVVWIELDGVTTLRPEDGARVFVTTCRFRTGDERYGWLNAVFVAANPLAGLPRSPSLDPLAIGSVTVLSSEGGPSHGGGLGAHQQLSCTGQDPAQVRIDGRRLASPEREMKIHRGPRHLKLLVVDAAGTR